MPRLPVQMSYYNPVIERLSREELLQLQWKRLKNMLEQVYYTNPYYRRLMQRLKISPDEIKSRQDFAEKIPLTTKKDMVKDQQENPPYGDRLGVPPEKLFRPWITSGISGQGQEVYGLTRVDAERSQTAAQSIYWAGLRRGEVAACTFPSATGNLAGPDNYTRIFEKLGSNLLHLGATFTLEQKLERMKRFSPHFMIAVGAYLARLRAGCQEQGLQPRKDFPRLKSIVTGVSPWSVEWVQDMEDFWDARLFDVYSFTQGRVTVGYTCEHGAVVGGKRGLLHLTEDLLYIEVVDRETRQPVRPGEEGEIIATTLALESAPLLRFALNDKGRYLPHNMCPCGRPFDGLEAGNVSRYDDMLKIRMLNIWPQAVDEVLFACNEVAEYMGRVWVDSQGQEQVTVSIEFKEHVAGERKLALMPQLAVSLKERIGLTMAVEEASEPVPRFQYKAVRWRDERLKGIKRAGF